MYPPKLPEENKRNWDHLDVFTDAPMAFVRAFLHRNYEINMHSHSFYEINIVLAGAGRHYIGEEDCAAWEGCVFVIPPTRQHGYYREGTLDVFHILIDGAFFQRYEEELQLLDGFSVLFVIEPLLRGRLQEDLFIVLDPDRLRRMRESLARLEEYDKGYYRGDAVLANAEVLMIIGQLSNMVSQQLQQDGEKRPERYVTEVLRTMEYIRTHCHEKLAVDLLCKRLCMSRATFQRAFQRISGQSVTAYVLEARIQRGCALLRTTDRSISDIAQMCGFFDASHFSNAFSHAMGTSPRAFRHQELGGQR